MDLRDDGIKKINMLIIFFLPSLYSSFRHLRRVTVSLVNKMTVLSRNDCEVPFRKVCFRSLTCDIIFSGALCPFFPCIEAFYNTCVQMCVQYANNYFRAADPVSPSDGNITRCIVQVSLSLFHSLWEMFRVPPEQSEASLDWPLQGPLFIPRFCQMITV